MIYEDKVRVMLEYLQLKVQEKDWHGVADAAMDLRDIDTEQKTKEGIYEKEACEVL
jgi:hypothetical protein